MSKPKIPDTMTVKDDTLRHLFECKDALRELDAAIRNIENVYSGEYATGLDDAAESRLKDAKANARRVLGEKV